MKKIIENKQKGHYEAIHDDYSDHYYDKESLAYRKKFILEPLFKGINLDDAIVADLAAGIGMTSSIMGSYFPNAKFSGFDISSKACKEYKDKLGFPSYEVDLTKKYNADVKFDAAIVIGGLHHCISDLEMTINNIGNLIKKDGHFLMMEPNADYFLEPIRKFWYKKDKYFESDTERALKHDEILKIGKNHFKLVDVQYCGGIAYFLIFNSLIFRMPKSLKKILKSILFKQEALFNKLPGKLPFAYFLAKWKKI